MAVVPFPSDTKVSASAAAPGTSRRAILSDSDECWTSQTVPAEVHLVFPTPVRASRFALTFQGGFVGTSASIYIAVKPSDEEGPLDLGLMLGGKVHPEDKNKRQEFDIPWPPTVKPGEIAEFKIEFEASSDHHGRVTLYQLELLA